MAEAGREAAPKKKKGYQGPAPALRDDAGLDNSRFRLLGSWQPGPTWQTEDVSIPVDILTKRDCFAKGGEPHPGALTLGANAERPRGGWEHTGRGVGAVSGTHGSTLRKLRIAAEVHRQARRDLQSWVTPGMRMVDICERLERKVEALVGARGFERGKGFPTGVSLNNVAAHYTPNHGDETVLQEGDICKVDFGVQIDGYIIDSAFTIAFDPRFDPLIESTREATRMGISMAGADASLTDIGAAIEEVITSYEMEGKPVRPVANLAGHRIGRYRIHDGASVPIVRGSGARARMAPGEIYAVETFASTGRGHVADSGECSHYMVNYQGGAGEDAKAESAALGANARALYKTILKEFHTLAWCRRWLDDKGHTQHALPLQELVRARLISPYPPLADQRKCHTSQSEHTIAIGETRVEVLSAGDDY